MLACGFVRTPDRKALECLSAPPASASAARDDASDSANASGWGLSVFALKMLCQQRVELQRILAGNRTETDGVDGYRCG